MGCRVHYKSFSRIIKNPFYCGYISHSLIPGELHKGHHPALVSETLFLKANQVAETNPLRGIPKKFKIEELPLKKFAKDEVSLSPFTGYVQKNIYYYKSRLKNSCINVRADYLHGLFLDELKKYEFGKNNIQKLEENVFRLIEQKIKVHSSQIDALNEQRKNLKRKIESLEERFIEQNLSQELFEKYTGKYKADLAEIDQKLSSSPISSSNLKKAVTKGIEIASNLSQLWFSSDYNNKQRLQYLIFPEGMLFNKQKNIVRTPKVNSLFQAIPLLASVSQDNKKSRLVKNGFHSHLVARTRIPA